MNKAFKNVIPVLALMLISIMFSCTHKKIKKDSVIVPTEDVSTPTPAPTTPPLSVELVVVNVKLIAQSMATNNEISFLAKAEIKMHQVLQSKEFHDFMSARKMVQTNGRSSAEVATHLQSLKGEIPVNFYYAKMRNRYNPFGTSVVAYRQPPSNEININRAYYDSVHSDLCEYAGTLAHETVCHTLGGYDHDYYDTTERPFSVCYSINAAFEKICKK